jgi:hypothetical protein
MNATANETARLGAGRSQGRAGGAKPVSASTVKPFTSYAQAVGDERDRARRLLFDLSQIAVDIVPSRAWRRVARAWARAIDSEILGGRR